MKTTEEADSAARKEEKEVQRLELELAKGLSEIQTNFGDLLALAKT
jgi:hypothetical protein